MKVEELMSQCPVDHLSFSAVRSYIEDARNFRKKYIDYIYDDLTPQALAEGSAYHASLEEYWLAVQMGKEDDLQRGAFEAGADTLDARSHQTDWARKRVAKKDIGRYAELGCEIEEQEVGNKKVYYTTVNAGIAAQDLKEYLTCYFDNLPEYEPLFVEGSWKTQTKKFGSDEYHLLPVKGKIDMIALDKKKKTVLVDHKLMGSHPSKDSDGNYIVEPAARLQACCYETMVETGILEGVEKIDYFAFDVMVKGKTPVFHRVTFELTDADRLAWSMLLDSVIKQLCINSLLSDSGGMFIPNPFHGYIRDGWNEFMLDVQSNLDAGDKLPKKIEKKYEDHGVKI